MNLVVWYYQSVLDRDPEPGGAEGWAAEIERIISLGIDIREGFIALGKLFFTSEEYLSRDKSDNDYIIDLYETFLGRTPAQGEVDGWKAELAGGLTRNLLLNFFIFSNEFRVYMEGIFGDTSGRPEFGLVNDLYRGFLSRLPDNEGFLGWLQLMQEAQCTGEQAVRDLTGEIGLFFLHSEEYALRGTDNSGYTADLYDAILRRGAELPGYLDWLAELNSGMTREQALQHFADSAEFQGRILEVVEAGCAVWPEISLHQRYSGFTSPVYVTSSNDNSNRLFLFEQPGRVLVAQGPTVFPTPFLDITSRVLSGGERGLLSGAFPPDYINKGYFYVSYTRKPDGASVVSRFTIDPENANVALPSSEEIILIVDQPYSNHNGGQIAFGPNGFLYIGFGDGGSGGDPEGNGQNSSTLLGKILRVDVESGSIPYSIPDDNPFVGQTGYRPEIWALGLRNHWRFSFDRQNGDLYIADVGQNMWEEVDYQSGSSTGGENYGWNIMEGAHCYNAPSCDQTGLTLPVYEYDHTEGNSITGGYVYRGSLYERMQGIYFFGDYVNGKIWGLQMIHGEWKVRLLLDTNLNISSFGESDEGKLFVIDINGDIYELQDSELSIQKNEQG